ncbi:MAG: MFS transporter [Syntrophus sp. (in: bacteria)]|nr:MFS transporter [Syntrophus sp. (in: bacteria)]
MIVSDPTESPKLFSFEFLALCLILVAAFANVSVFYGFYHYLGNIGIPVAWRGFLVGLEPMAAFALRLFVIPLIHTRNALAVLTAALILMIIASCSYLWVLTVPLMIVLRILHGAAFVLLTSAVIALIVQFIPREKSGQGFSIVSISTMIPYAVIPTFTEILLPHVKSEAVIYAGVSVFSMMSLLLLITLKKRLANVLGRMDDALARRPRMDEIRENFRQHSVVLLLGTAFLVYLAHAAVFYFTKDLSLQTAIGDMGPFFTISMVSMIAVRALGSALFDRTNKLYLFQAGLVFLILCLVLLPQAGTRPSFYLLAGLYGTCMGIILPLLNALLFSASAPPLRGLNTNLAMFTMDAGYFLMPYLGGIIIAFGAGFDILFYVSAGFILLSLSLVMLLTRLQRKE